MAKSNDNVAYIYGQALYEAAKEAGALVEIEAQFVTIVDALQKHQDTRGTFFGSPVVSFEDKARVYRKAFGGKVHPLLLNFVLTAAKHSRSPAMFKLCLHYFRQHCNQLEGIAELDVSSARKLDDAEMAKLKATMTKKLGRKVVVREKVDPSLLGGFVVLHQNQQWDATVSSRLNRLKKGLQETKFPNTVLKD